MKRFIFFSITFALLSASSLTAHARDMYFMGTATSNFTLDSKALNCTYGTCGAGCYIWTCNYPSLKCRVMAVNLSDSPQSVTIEMDYVTKLASSSNFNFAAPNPFVDSTGATLNYATVLETGSKAWKGNISNGSAAFVTATSPFVLNSQEAVIYEEYRDNPNYQLNNGAGGTTITSFNSTYPFAKWFSTCSGKISVTDVTANTPGFVVASGSLDYFANSYQNPVVNYGGYPSLTTFNAAVNVQTFVESSAASSCRVSHTATNPGDVIYLRSFGFANSNATANGSCNIQWGVNNQHRLDAAKTPNASATRPLQIGNSPIIINGGSPF